MPELSENVLRLHKKGTSYLLIMLVLCKRRPPRHHGLLKRLLVNCKIFMCSHDQAAGIYHRQAPAGALSPEHVIDEPQLSDIMLLVSEQWTD